MEQTTSKKQQRKIQEPKAQGWYAKRVALNLPKYSLGEEIFSAVVHGVSALVAVAAMVLLLVFGRKEPVVIASVSIFGGSMILLYTVSTLYHALNINRAKKVFRILDHCAIFLLIAGTYTPITLVCIGGSFGWGMFAGIWGAAAIGITLNAIDLKRFAKISMVCYLLMGWGIVFIMDTLTKKASSDALLMLLVGGIFYTAGAVLYLFGKKCKYMHSVWHLFVLLGSIFHCFTVYHLVAL